MNDIFNENNNPVEGTQAEATQPTPQTAPQEPVQSTSQAGAPMGTPPSGNAYGNAFNTTYNQAYTTPQAPYSQSQPYNTQQTQYGVPPYNTGYTQTAYIDPKHPPKKNKSGKSVFIALICICIAVASVAIGITASKGSEDNKKTQTEQSDNNTKKGNSSGAEANVEDSPISFSEYSGDGPMTPEQIYEVAKEVNVGVIVYALNEKVGEGSGIVVGADKEKKYTYIITAAHVISEQGVSIQVQFNDETELDAEIVGYDTKTDIGVLKVAKTGFKAATFGNSNKLNVGQKVYAIGNPGGTEFFGSFTNGIISAIDRPIASSTSAYDLPCIQHNAAINPGNSGGALLNEYGQVIGLNSSKITATDYEGMGFSVPSNTMLEIYKDIVANGYVTNRPILGISYYSVASDYTYSAIAWKNNLPYGSIVIAAISDSSDLTKQGIEVGDIIIGVNGKPLDSTDVLLEVIENSNVGDTLTLSVCRLTNNGSVSSKFDAEVKLIEDKGETVSVQKEQTTDPFSSYFGGGFGY